MLRINSSICRRCAPAACAYRVHQGDRLSRPAVRPLSPPWQPLPSLNDWLETMHRRPLIRTQKGAAAKVTEFNDCLKHDLELIGVKHLKFTLHAIRNQDIGEGAPSHATHAHSGSPRPTLSRAPPSISPPSSQRTPMRTPPLLMTNFKVRRERV